MAMLCRRVTFRVGFRVRVRVLGRRGIALQAVNVHSRF